MDKQIWDIPSFFSPVKEMNYAFYRPLSREFYGFITFNLFHLSPLPYHIFNIIIILLNGYLACRLGMEIGNKKIYVLFGGILYIFSAVHSIELYYLSSVQTLLSTTFVLSGLISYRSFLFSRNGKYLFYSLVLFILAILSHESSIVFLGLIFVLECLNLKKINITNVKKMMIYLLPFIILVLIRVSIMITVKGLPAEDVYQPQFSVKTALNSLMWYSLWSIGLPEMLVDFVGSKFAINPNFFRWYGQYAKIVFPLTVYAILYLSLSLVRLRHVFLRQKSFLIYILFYLISLSPFLFFPLHKFIYYLSLPMVWFSLLLGIILGESWRAKGLQRLLAGIFISSFIIVSYMTININKITHWSAKRAEAAKVLLGDIKRLYPKINRNQIFYFTDDPYYPNIAKEWGSSSKQAFYILSGSDALQLLYNDISIKAYYQAVPESFNVEENKNVIQYTAKFPY